MELFREIDEMNFKIDKVNSENEELDARITEINVEVNELNLERDKDFEKKQLATNMKRYPFQFCLLKDRSVEDCYGHCDKVARIF